MTRSENATRRRRRAAVSGALPALLLLAFAPSASAQTGKLGPVDEAPPVLTPYYPPAPPPPPPPPRLTGRERPARALDTGSWIGTSDYPIEALRGEAEGAVVVRYTVNAIGRIEGCEVVESSGVEALDRASCALLSVRARFDPARGARGERVASVRRQRIVWRLPEQADPVPYRQGRVVVIAPVERDGVAACDVRARDVALAGFGFDICVGIFPESGAGADAAVTAIATLSDANAPAPLPMPLAAPLLGSVDARFTIETDGRVTGCSASDSGDDVPFSFCDFFEGEAGEGPYFQPVAARRAVRAQLRIHRGRIPVSP